MDDYNYAFHSELWFEGESVLLENDTTRYTERNKYPMQLFFGVTYLLFFTGVVIASLFIMFHLSRYALNRRIATGMTLLFVVVTTVLLLANALLFFSLPLDTLLIPTRF